MTDPVDPLMRVRVVNQPDGFGFLATTLLFAIAISVCSMSWSAGNVAQDVALMREVQEQAATESGGQ